MALITCPECGKEYSNLASACPNCGCPTKIVNPTVNSRPVIVSKKKNTSNVEVTENGDTIVKTFKRLPSVPNLITIVAIIFIPFALMSYFSAVGTLSLIDNIVGESTFSSLYMTDGELAFSIIISTWSVISLIGIYRLKQWGLLSYVACKSVNLLYLLIGIFFWGVTLSGILMNIMYVALYLCTFMFEESGHSAFEILMNNGVINESKNSNLDETKE